jgi:hypothetical protein
MNVSGLLIDSITKVLFFGGLIMIVFGISINETHISEFHQRIEQYRYKRIELKYDKKLDSIEVINAKNRIVALNEKTKKNNLSAEIKDTLLNKIKDTELVLLKKTTLNNKRDEEIKQLLIDINDFSDVVHEDFIKSVVLIIGGAFFLIIGIFKWGNKDTQEEIGLKRRFQIETKEGSCQSCGIILKYDIKPFVKKGFCSTCFDGEKYKEPNLTFAEMSERIQKRMKELGVKDNAIKTHINKLKDLNRWALTLRW